VKPSRMVLPEPRQIVISLLIDDGVADRGHRQTLLDPEFRVLGAALGTHASYRSMCVLTFASDYREGNAPVPARGTRTLPARRALPLPVRRARPLLREGNTPASP